LTAFNRKRLLKKVVLAFRHKIAYKALRIQVGVIAGFHYDTNLLRRSLLSFVKVTQKQRSDRELIDW